MKSVVISFGKMIASKLTSVFFGYLVLACAVVQGARRLSARQQLRESSSLVPGFSRRRSVDDSQSGNSGDVFGLQEGEEFEAVASATTAQGTTQFKLKETYHKQEVFGASITVTLDSDGETIHDATGEYVVEMKSDLSEPAARMDEGELFSILILASGDENRRHLIKSQKIVYDIYTDETETAHNVAILDYLIETDDIQKRPIGMINVKTGEVIYHYDSMETCFSVGDLHLLGGNRKIGQIKYGESQRCLDVKEQCGMCHLENDYAKVVNMNFSGTEPTSQAAKFWCCGSMNDTVNGAYSPAIDALYYGTETVKMFRQWYNTEPLKNRLVLRVHFGKNVLNAFWNGHNVSFGDGRKRLVYPLVGLDITAHEIAHGFTEQNSGLLYIGQAGGINEAFSDMTGEMAEHFVNKMDWRVGSDVMYRGSMRYLDNPEKDKRSISHISKYSPRLPPHLTSGIYNKVFYQLVEKHSLDPVEVYRVFLHANKMYWQPFTNFTLGACDVMQAAYDMGQPGEPFVAAFAQAGIDVCDVEDHIHHVRSNNTMKDIMVSNVTKPAFALEVPEWRKNLIISARSDHGDVTIRVFSDPWTKIKDTTVPLTQGINHVTYGVLDMEQRVFVFVLSTEGSALTDVRLTAGYSCQDNYRNPKCYRCVQQYGLECKLS